MNQNLVELHNKCGVVSDEKGNVCLVSKENSDYNFKDILSKENEIEHLKSQLESVKESVDTITKENVSAVSTNTIMLLLTIALIVILHPFELSIASKIILPASFYVMTKVGILCEFGTQKHRNLKLNELINTINELEKKIPKMDRELQLMKEKTNFVSLYTTSDKTKYHNFSCDFPIDNENCINQNKIKVLSLTKK